MNNEADIVTKIDIVFKNEQLAYRSNGRIKGGLGTFNVKMQVWRTASTSGNSSLLPSKPSHDAIKSRSSDLLLKLYAHLGEEGRGVFKRELSRILTGPSRYQSQSYLAYYVLFRIGERVSPVGAALVNMKDDTSPNYGRGNLLAMLSKVLMFEYNRFNSSDLNALNEVLKWVPANQDFECKDMITEIHMKLLEEELSDVNPAINIDRDRVIDFWQETFGSSEVRTQIDQIEELFTEGVFDEAKLATCLGRVRVLLIDSLMKLASQLSKSNDLQELKSKPKDGEVIDWYKEQGLLNQKEKKLIRAMYDLCSDEGAHASVSKKEYARIAKNVTYECLVMVIGLVPSK